MNRNVNDYFSKTPTPHFPRSRFDMGIHKRLQTQQHGRLTPFFCRIVYPGDTWQMDMSTFVRADTSVRVPLDDIYLDTYFFFVPFRILDSNFAKVLGDVEPYDDTEYSFPQLRFADTYLTNSLFLPSYLGLGISSVTASGTAFTLDADVTINPYSIAAYYKIYNDWFRDENVDYSYPIGDLLTTSDADNLDGDVWGDSALKLNVLKVNKYHDYFTSAMISPQKGPAVTIPLGTSAPVGTIPSSNAQVNNGYYFGYAGNELFQSGVFNQADPINSSNGSVASALSPLVADLSEAAGTINQLRLAFAIQALYERRGRYGTRYIETIRGQWGIEVPDSFFERPEYLGGSRTTLNNVPVLSTENSSQLGQMAGNSATLSGGNSWTKTFVEYGVIIGVSATRIKHSYSQGYPLEIFGLKTGLDLYNPVFANIGFKPILNKEIYAQGLSADDEVFAYQEAWAELRTQTDSFAGLFGSLSTDSDLKNYWHYGDYYASLPTFSADWLKEDASNVTRTLTGQLINNSTNDTIGHQFMFGYYFHPIVTRILPSHSIPVELIGRL